MIGRIASNRLGGFPVQESWQASILRSLPCLAMRWRCEGVPGITSRLITDCLHPTNRHASTVFTCWLPTPDHRPGRPEGAKARGARGVTLGEGNVGLDTLARRMRRTRGRRPAVAVNILRTCGTHGPPTLTPLFACRCFRRPRRQSAHPAPGARGAQVHRCPRHAPVAAPPPGTRSPGLACACACACDLGHELPATMVADDVTKTVTIHLPEASGAADANSLAAKVVGPGGMRCRARVRYADLRGPRGGRGDVALQVTFVPKTSGNHRAVLEIDDRSVVPPSVVPEEYCKPQPPPTHPHTPAHTPTTPKPLLPTHTYTPSHTCPCTETRTRIHVAKPSTLRPPPSRCWALLLAVPSQAVPEAVQHQRHGLGPAGRPHERWSTHQQHTSRLPARIRPSGAAQRRVARLFERPVRPVWRAAG